MQLEKLKKYGYRVEAETYVEEVQSKIYQLRHEKSKARILILENEEPNKTFCIGFETIPEDSTGVFHILEHSVLNGSNRYPSKEIFVDLMKTSMKNFLNAMTFADKTIYPFATVNEKDYMNLMDVYLNAVFYPKLRSDKKIFRQEGWHYEMDVSTQSQEEKVSGVVYNEMKGVFSSIDMQLNRYLEEALFPDSPYKWVSGGHPDHIPELSYEKFLSTYHRFYRSDNCYIILSGKMDYEEKLAFISEEYLNKMEVTKPYNEKIEKQQAVCNINIKQYYSLSNETGRDVQSSIAFSIGDISDRYRIMSTFVLLSALMGNNDAPLKKRLLRKGLGEDVIYYVNDGILQPYITFNIKNTTVEKEAVFWNTLKEEVTEIIQNGIDKDALIAAINSMEFAMNENNGSLPDGIMNAIQAITGWIHSGDPILFLQYNDYFKRMKQELETEYFEELLGELISQNDYRVQVSMIPESMRPLGEATVEETGKGDTQELVKLKLLYPLSLEDLEQKAQDIKTEEKQDKNINFFHRELKTNGVFYGLYYFNLNQIDAQYLGYIQLYLNLLGDLSTDSESAEQLNIQLSTWIGNYEAYIDTFTDCNIPDQLSVKLVLGISVLNHNLGQALDLIDKLLLHTIFTEKEKIKKSIEQTKLYMERSFVSNGNYYASLRTASYYSQDGLCKEFVSGYTYYEFICDILSHFDEKIEDIIAQLKKVQQEIIEKAPLTISYSGNHQTWNSFKNYIQASEIGRVKRRQHERLKTCHLPEIKNEAFIIDSNVSYNMCGGKMLYSGKKLVMCTILSLDYLWKKIRMEGGAYGAGIHISTNNSIMMNSYRDPSVAKTYQNFLGIYDYLKKFEADDETMLNYMIGTMAQFETVTKAYGTAKKYDRRLLCHWSLDTYQQIRSEICSVTVDDLNRLAQEMKVVMESQKNICTFGNEEAICQNQQSFEVIYRNLK